MMIYIKFRALEYQMGYRKQEKIRLKHEKPDLNVQQHMEEPANQIHQMHHPAVQLLLP